MTEQSKKKPIPCFNAQERLSLFRLLTEDQKWKDFPEPRTIRWITATVVLINELKSAKSGLDQEQFAKLFFLCLKKTSACEMDDELLETLVSELVERIKAHTMPIPTDSKTLDKTLEDLLKNSLPDGEMKSSHNDATDSASSICKGLKIINNFDLLDENEIINKIDDEGTSRSRNGDFKPSFRPKYQQRMMDSGIPSTLSEQKKEQLLQLSSFADNISHGVFYNYLHDVFAP